jgi:hypothetical protein
MIEILLLETEVNLIVSPSYLVSRGDLVYVYGGWVKRGDKVWMYRNTPTYPALVSKVVCWVNPSRCEVGCSYPDKRYVRKENALYVYASEEMALEAEPKKAASLEHCWQRAGRRQGFTLKETVPA